MSTYKLIQDIEAEDKILGPLTLRQFIFALVTAFFIYISVLCVARHLTFLLIVFLPPGLLTGFFAFPFGRDQPTEIWALAKLRFWFKPRKRLWDQSGVKQLVTITVPKKVEHVFTDGLSQNEVESRLKALANTIDSRGWAVKNVNINVSAPNNPMAIADSDRLVAISNIPQEVPDATVQASDDILDEQNNPIAQQFDAMINQSNQSHRKELLQQLNAPAAMPQPAPQTASVATDPWFMAGAPVPTPAAATPEEAAVLAQAHAQSAARQVTYGNLRTIQPLGSQPAAAPQPAPQMAAPAPMPAMTPQPDPAILSLANNNDLNVATLAREAQKAKAGEMSGGEDEVVISLR